MDYSFVIYFHSSRMANLKQTVSFLSRREAGFLPRCELVLVCQDYVPALEFPAFGACRTICCQTDTYNKPRMCNLGVSAAIGSVVVLLDSDRVLPLGYFARNCRVVRREEAVSTYRLYECRRPYSDQAIESGDVEKIADFKSRDNEVRCKNGFSGNTILWREDYLKCGGMDESFEGYGFADTDMVDNFNRHGNHLRFEEDEELHLYHPKEIVVGGETLTLAEYRLMTLRNGMKYCLKWKKFPPNDLLELYREIRTQVDTEGCFDPKLWEESREFYRRFRIL